MISFNILKLSKKDLRIAGPLVFVRLELITVIAEISDGDTYGEGGNHFIHTIRRNPNIINIVHNNMACGHGFGS